MVLSERYNINTIINMEARKILEQIIDMNESEIISEREKLIWKLMNNVSHPEHSMSVMTVELSMFEVMGFMETFIRFKQKKSENLPGFYEDFMEDLYAWINKKQQDFEDGVSDHPCDFFELDKTIRFYASEAEGEEKNTVLGLIIHLIRHEGLSEFNTMNQAARFQMYVYALVKLKLPMWGKK